jgi:hypothetical protein
MKNLAYYKGLVAGLRILYSNGDKAHRREYKKAIRQFQRTIGVIERKAGIGLVERKNDVGEAKE